MKELHVDLAGRGYEITIAPGVLDRAGEYVGEVCPEARRLAVVTDTNVAPLYLERVCAGLEAAGFETVRLTVPAGESSKCAGQLERLWEEMLDGGMHRTDAVVALGGGVVGDLAGFAAATLLRGVALIQLPTTLLAQVDSSVGGKVAIDLRHGKNLAGCFWQPRAVLMDPEALCTLSDSVFADGMAEVIKYGCIADLDFFRFLCAHPSRAEVMEHIEHVLYTCCDWKRRVVEADERDTGLRMILNFGHTVAHAFERLGNYGRYTHGQAVAAGMCAAVELGRRLGYAAVSEADAQALTQLLSAFGLPTRILCAGSEWDTVAEAVGLDKKSAGEELTMIFLERMGKALPVRLKRDAVLAALEPQLRGARK